MRSIKLILLLLVILSFYACKKKKETKEEETEVVESSNGMLVLCEGLFQQNNSTLSWIDLKSENIDNDFFVTQNGRLLGDTGNDMKQYGSKIYIVVNASSTIEILDKKTFKSIKQIDMKNGSIAKQPRNIEFNNGKAFVTCFDGYVDVIDTVTLSISQRIKVGSNPEDLAISSNKLYVSNSGGLNAPNVDSTVSVISLNNLQEIKKIVVGKNPGRVHVDSNGDVYVIARGNYTNIPSRLKRIDSNTDELVQSFSFDASGISTFNNQFLITYYNYNTQQSSVSLFDPVNETVINSNYINTSNITTLYGVQYDSKKQKIYCFDAMNYTNTGYVHQYSSTGVFEKSYHVGLNPNSILFYE